MLFVVCVVAPLAGYWARRASETPATTRHAYSCRAGSSILVASKVRGNLFAGRLAFRAVEKGPKKKQDAMGLRESGVTAQTMKHPPRRARPPLKAMKLQRRSTEKPMGPPFQCEGHSFRCDERPCALSFRWALSSDQAQQPKKTENGPNGSQ